jgi:hypothetical protein
MMIFLCGKLLDFIVLDKTYAIPANIHTLVVTDAGAKAKYEANAKAVDHLVRSLCVLTVKIRQPSQEFTFGVGMNFIPYPLVLTPVV